jgi:hypothetical protein
MKWDGLLKAVAARLPFRDAPIDAENEKHQFGQHLQLGPP